jgi:hypothetical protein
MVAMIYPPRMIWRLRTVFGEDVLVVQEGDAGAQDRSQRLDSLFVQCDLRDWLLGPDAFDRETVIEMYCGLGREMTPAGLVPRSESYLLEMVLPALQEAFRDGRLVALKRPLSSFSAFKRLEKEPDAQPGEQPADWIEVIVTDETGEPYLGPYRLDLPDGRVVSGELDMGGAVRAEGIPGGSCTIAFPELYIRLAGDR